MFLLLLLLHTQQGGAHVTPRWTAPCCCVHSCSGWAAAQRPRRGCWLRPRTRSAPSPRRSAGNSWAVGWGGVVRASDARSQVGSIVMQRLHFSLVLSSLNMKRITPSWPTPGGIRAHTCQGVFGLAGGEKINDSLAAVSAQQQTQENRRLLPNSFQQMHFKTIIKGSVRASVVWITCNDSRSCPSVLILPGIIPVSRHPGRWTGLMDTGQCFPAGRRGHRWRWWGSAGGSPSGPIRDLTDHKKKGFHMHCCVSVYAISARCARTPVHACQEDLRGHWATLQAGTVSTLRRCKGVGDRRNWKEKVEGERLLDVGLGLTWRKCGICGVYLPAGSVAWRAMLSKVLLHCFLMTPSPPAGNCGSLCKLSSLRRLFRMDCKGSLWHLNTTQHCSYLKGAYTDPKTRHYFVSEKVTPRGLWHESTEYDLQQPLLPNNMSPDNLFFQLRFRRSSQALTCDGARENFRELAAPPWMAAGQMQSPPRSQRASSWQRRKRTWREAVVVRSAGWAGSEFRRRPRRRWVLPLWWVRRKEWPHTDAAEVLFVRAWEPGFLSSCTPNSALRYLTLLSHPPVNKKHNPAKKKMAKEAVEESEKRGAGE